MSWYVFLLIICLYSNVSFQSFLRSGRPMLLKFGYKEGFLLHVERLIFEEMREAKEPQYSRIERVYARKAREIPPIAFGSLVL